MLTDSNVMDPLLKDSTFRCRKCRVRLFTVDELQSHKDQKLKWDLAAGPTDLSSYDKCSSWFLSDEDMLPWINESVEEVCVLHLGYLHFVDS